MDDLRFDLLTRGILAMLSRRTLTGALGLAPLALLGVADAKKKRNRKRKIGRNQFGCVNVGKSCEKDSHCCSGICHGKTGKKTCKGHDAGGCRAGQHQAICGGANVFCETSDGLQGFCDTTTGKAGYCSGLGDCFACKKDTDCQPFCDPGAACIQCATFCPETGTACVGTSGCEFPPEA